MKPTIVVIDYQKGNLRSVERGLEAAGADVIVSSDADVIARAQGLVLPGVGAFEDAMTTMVALGQDEAIRHARAQGATFLGICLGLHLLFAEGEERALEDADGTVRGLGFAPGVCFKVERADAEGRTYKVPHVGWNTLQLPAGDARARRRWEACPLLADISPDTYFYFTHSYRAPASEATVAETMHARRFPSVVQLDERTFGVQFHPEKSSDAGAKVLRNFVGLTAAAGRDSAKLETRSCDEKGRSWIFCRR